MFKAFRGGVNLVCQQGLDGLICNWPLFVDLCRSVRPSSVLAFALSLQEDHLAKIKHLWPGAIVHVFRGRQILFVRSEDVAMERSVLGSLKKLMNDQQAGKATLDRLSRNRL